nr:reverse transcriptase domain-containing protein [Tanacetum cinerariifolium]
MFTDYKSLQYILDQKELANVLANALSRKEREKLIRVRALVMTVHTDLFKRILKAQTKAMTSPKNPEWLRLDLGYRRSVNQVSSLLAHKRGHFKGLWEVIHFEKRGKLSPRYVGLFKIIDRVGPVEYKLELPRELQGIHNTFYVSNLKKCLADENLIIPLKEIQLDDKFHFIEELVEITDREVKQLKQSRIPIVKPMSLQGIEGVVGLTRWIEKMESVLQISNCTVACQVKFASYTLQGSALTWWNSHMRVVGQDVSYTMPWAALKRMITSKYCPREEPYEDLDEEEEDSEEDPEMDLDEEEDDPEIDSANISATLATTDRDRIEKTQDQDDAAIAAERTVIAAKAAEVARAAETTRAAANTEGSNNVGLAAVLEDPILKLPEQLSRVYSTFYMSDLKKCLSDEPLAISLDEVHIDDKLHFVEELVEIKDREVKRLKQSRIPIIKVQWNSRRGPEFT